MAAILRGLAVMIGTGWFSSWFTASRESISMGNTRDQVRHAWSTFPLYVRVVLWLLLIYGVYRFIESRKGLKSIWPKK